MGTDADKFAAAVRRFSGFADQYDRCRPQPPAALASVLTQILGGARPALVVDLGSGTGLSSRYWADKALQVVGVEPTADMRARAGSQTDAANVRYESGYSHHTGLPSASADIVVCMQALHWMEPQATFEEARRILHPGGVFAAVDYDWPPLTGDWRSELAWMKCSEHVARLEESLPRESRPRRWDKAQHLARMQDSGCFRYCRELLLHHQDVGNAERFIALLHSQGGVQDLLKAGRSRTELGIDVFETAVRGQLGARTAPWCWSARVRVGVV